jgi:spectinomycin phosphotransferase/16S rRNA (guanine(1405)-N(7))-methyltransferase
VLTRPPDLSDEAIAASLATHWGFEAAALEYRPVGFGAHHWKATDAAGDARFVTVHDLAAKRQDAAETTDGVFRRLDAAFSAAAALADHGLTFVLAPTRDRGGRVVARVDDRFSLAVHPYLVGHPAGPEGAFTRPEDRVAVVDLVVDLHRHGEVAASRADRDDLVVRHHEEIPAAIDALGARWDTGPYGERARALLQAHADPLQDLVAAYEELASEVSQLGDRAVLTHGEPDASNVLVVRDQLLLIDWDTALLAVAERDLWDLDPGDGSALEQYRRATGVELSSAALDLYRLWFDLAEIGQYLGELRRPHGETEDMAESWKNLQEFLRPAERWPALVR